MELIPKEVEKIQKKNSVPLKIADTAKFWQNDAFLGSMRGSENMKPFAKEVPPFIT